MPKNEKRQTLTAYTIKNIETNSISIFFVYIKIWVKASGRCREGGEQGRREWPYCGRRDELLNGDIEHDAPTRLKMAPRTRSLIKGAETKDKKSPQVR
jgi:hypothetical protein